MTRCPNCNTENSPEAMYCRQCGHALGEPAAEGESEVLPEELGELPPEAASSDTAARDAREAGDTAELAEAPGTPLDADVAEASEASEAEATWATVERDEQQAQWDQWEQQEQQEQQDQWDQWDQQDQQDEVVAAFPQRSTEPVETDSLIGEEDLPAWLRAWDANQDATAQDEEAADETHAWMLGGEPEEPPAPAPPESRSLPGDEVAPAWEASQPAARSRSRGEAVFAELAASEAVPEAGTPERVSAWRAPVEPERADQGGPQLPPRPAAQPIPVRSRRGRPRPSPAALVAVIVAFLFFLGSLVFFLVTVAF